MKLKLFFTAIILLVGSIREIMSQSFIVVNAGILPTISSASAWGDYDNDGDIDLLHSGSPSSLNIGDFTKLYRNDGNGVFTPINTSIVAINTGSVDWGDYDNDGNLDVLITGGENSTEVARIYRNNGGGIFTNINAGLTSVASSFGKWGDYDNDGYLDFIILGGNSTDFHFYNTKLYHNNQNGTFTSVNPTFIQPDISNYANGSADWGDYDNDGDNDLLISAATYTGSKTSLYRNDGGGVFTDINAGLLGLYQSSVDFGDYDNDGDIDILLAGREAYGLHSMIYRNDGGAFTDINAAFAGVSECSVEWGDYDNDCDLDALISGYNGGTNDVRLTKIYRNEGGSSFTEDLSLNLNGVSVCSSIWGDYDMDGDLDIFISGSDNTFMPSSILYRNNLNVPNLILANSDIYNSTCIDSRVIFNILANDLDADGDSSFLSIVSVKNGSVKILPNKNISYTPNPHSFTNDTILYKICNKHCPKGCDTALVVVIYADPIELFIPNLVTSNKDGLNDYFAITGLCTGTKLTISNRWGDTVFSSSDYKNEWNGENLSDGIYYYFLQDVSREKNWKGWLQLMR